MAADVDADVVGCVTVVASSEDSRVALDAARAAFVWWATVAESARAGVPASARWPAIATVAIALAAATAMRERRAG